MRRVAVVGCGGAGKTTLANALGERLGLPVVHLDEHYWQPGWIPTPDEEWREKQRDLVSADRWIADGNYSSTLDIRLKRADVVIILAFPRWRCFLRVLRRWLTHYGQPVQAPGCPERVSLEFLKWMWSYPSKGRQRLDSALARHGRRATVLQFERPREVRAFLAQPQAAACYGAAHVGQYRL
jgi:adenylate kinase family enzyme